jgi:elongation factor G
MKVYDSASIRNVALVGHSGSGKTQLTSAILSDTGMINRFGQVDDGRASPTTTKKKLRKHTLSASVTPWNKQKINLIDTPGMGNFSPTPVRHCRRRGDRRRGCRRRRHGADRKNLGGGREIAPRAWSS